MFTASHCPASLLSFTTQALQRLVCFLTSQTPPQPCTTCSCLPAPLTVPMATVTRSPLSRFHLLDSQPCTLLASLSPPCSSFADAPGLCPNDPSLFTLQANVSHPLALVTTCRPTAPKSLSLAQPPFQTIIYPKGWGSLLRLSSAETPGFSPRSPREAPAAPRLPPLPQLCLLSHPRRLSPAQALSSLPRIPQQPPTWSPPLSSTPCFTQQAGPAF